MTKRTYLLAISNFIFSFLVLFTFIVQENSLRIFDTDFTVLIQSKADHYIDFIFSWVSVLGRVEITFIVLFILFFIVKINQKILILFLFSIMHVIEIFLKSFIQQAGPPFSFYRRQVGENLLDSYTIPDFSYPSGHAARATFILMILLFIVIESKKLSFTQKNIILSLALPIFIAVIIGKVYHGEHWISDIIGGILLGLTFGIASYSVSTLSKESSRTRRCS